MSINLWLRVWRFQASLVWTLPSTWRDLGPFADGGIHKHHSAFRLGLLGLWLRAQYTNLP